MEKLKLSKEDALSQWQKFADEYNIPDDSEMTENDARTLSQKGIKAAIIRGIMAGFIEIADDMTMGIVIRQFIAHPVDGAPDTEPLVYSAPTVGHISRGKVGTSEDSANCMRYMRVAAALTSKSEPIMSRLMGGDRSRMENIASLFMMA
jgi:hypothetical protein